MPSALFAVLLAVSGAPAATVTPAEAPAAGRSTALVTVPAFGRHAIRVHSEEGVRLQLVDRMAGPGPEDGAAGEVDGRIDAFLDQGEYRLVLQGHDRAKGAARVEVLPFQELHENAPELIELRQIDATLGDLEQRSYWIRVESRREVALEAAGRSLSDLRLWRDGTWLVAAEPARERAQPRPGRPLGICRLAATLDPGLYLLTAYGGPALAWADDDGAQPFHLRAGIPALGSAGRRRFTASVFGVDRWRVPGSVTFARLELPEAGAASLMSGAFDPAQPFLAAAGGALIVKETVPPVAEVALAPRNEGEQVIAVATEAGQPYVLQHFASVERQAVLPPGELWVGTIQSGAPEDAFDATAVVVQRHPDGRVEVVAEDVVELHPSRGFARRGNLVGRVTVLLDVEEAGAWELRLRGTAAQARIEPWLLAPPRDYRAPALRPSGAVWELGTGLHVLTVEPTEKGILDVELRTASTPAVTARPVQAAVRLPRVNGGGQVHVNTQAGVRTGVIARRRPLDLADPLFLAVRPGEVVAVPFHASEPGTLSATAEDGTALPITVEEGAPAAAVRVPPGTSTAFVRGERTRTTLASLAFTPDRLRAEAPLPALPDTARAAIPEFPRLSPGEPRHLDLGRDGEATFRLAVAEPGLYEITTTGLLSTRAAVRTRTSPQLAAAAGNGVGRNASVRQYLREGEYQVAVSVADGTFGRLGVRVDRTPMAPGGFLTSFVPARTTLPTGSGVAYRFNITNPGRFRLRALGLGRQFRVRVEDLEGWPVAEPGSDADLTLDYRPGRYRVIVLPEATPARAVTVIEPLSAVRVLEGHGPHRLPLGRRQAHLWTEPESGGAREPDVWDVPVPADLDATIELGGEMQADLVRVEDGVETKTAFVPPGRGWRGSLSRGAYRLKVVAARIDNRARYTVAVWPEPLVEGIARDVTLPADLAVAVGADGLYELTTFGATDVAATLFDPEGRKVAAGDDRPDDWNAHLAVPLSAGRYRLLLHAVAQAGGSTRVALRRPDEKVQPALLLPSDASVRLGRATFVWPLELPPDVAVLRATARAPETVGLALEAQVAGTWHAVASAVGRAPRVEAATGAAAAAWRLRAWSLDRRDAEVRVQAMALGAVDSGEPDLARGVAPGAGAVRVRLDRPGVFQAGDGVRVCAQPLTPCTSGAEPVALPGREAWLVADGPARLSRVVLQPGTPVSVWTPPVPPGAPLAPLVLDVGGSGPRVVRATTRAGQPGVTFGARSAAFAPGSLSAVAATAGDEPVVTAWPALPGGGPQEIRLALQSFGAAGPPVPLAGGVLDGEVAAGASREVDLGSGRKRVVLSLGEGMVAHLGRSVHGGGLAVTETLETEAERLTLLPTAGGAPFSITSVPLAGEAGPRLLAGAAMEADLAAAGVLRLAVGAQPNERLHVRGAAGEPLLLTREGTVSRGTDLPAATGTLLIPHGPGLLLAWIDSDERPGPWPPATVPAARVARLPASVPLEGRLQSVAFDLPAPAMLHVRAPVRAVTLLRRAGGPPHVTLGADGVRLDAWVPAGRTTLDVRALGAGALLGALDVTTTPVTVVSDGLGPEVLLAPGASRLFAFETSRAAPVGIGLRASADSVDVALLDEAGAEIGRGAAQMPRLQPGRYLLALTARPGGPTVQARVALAGLVPPDTGPPPEVAQRYLAADADAPEWTAAFPAPGGGPHDDESIEDMSIEDQDEDEDPEEGDIEEER